MDMESPLPPPFVDPRLDILAASWPLLPALTMLSEQSPNLHVHISMFAHRFTASHPDLMGPVGPVLAPTPPPAPGLPLGPGTRRRRQWLASGTRRVHVYHRA